MAWGNVLSAITTISYYPQSIVKPLSYISKISPIIASVKYVARTKALPYINYVPGNQKIQAIYDATQQSVSNILEQKQTLSYVLKHRNTAASLSALGTTAAMLSCGAPAILIVGSSLLSATSTWYQHQRSNTLDSKEKILDQQILIIEQSYPYVCDSTTLSMTDRKTKVQTTQKATAFTAMDYSKFALDMCMAANSSFMGQTNLLWSPIMLFRENQRMNRLDAKEQKYEEMLSKIKPEDRDRLKKLMQKSKDNAGTNSTPEPQKEKQVAHSTSVTSRKGIRGT